MLRYTWALVLYAAGLGSALPLHRAPAEAALHQYETDPLALRDSFATLAPHLQSAWVSSAAGRTLTDVLAGACSQRELRQQTQTADPSLTQTCRVRWKPTPRLISVSSGSIMTGTAM